MKNQQEVEVVFDGQYFRVNWALEWGVECESLKIHSESLKIKSVERLNRNGDFQLIGTLPEGFSDYIKSLAIEYASE